MPTNGRGLQSGNTTHNAACCFWWQPLMLYPSNLFIATDAIHHICMTAMTLSTSSMFPLPELHITTSAIHLTTMMAWMSSTLLMFPYMELMASTKWHTTTTTYYHLCPLMVVRFQFETQHPLYLCTLKNNATSLRKTAQHIAPGSTTQLKTAQHFAPGSTTQLKTAQHLTPGSTGAQHHTPDQCHISEGDATPYTDECTKHIKNKNNNSMPSNWHSFSIFCNTATDATCCYDNDLQCQGHIYLLLALHLTVCNHSMPSNWQSFSIFCNTATNATCCYDTNLQCQGHICWLLALPLTACN